MGNGSDEKVVLRSSKMVVVYHEVIFAFLVGWGLVFLLNGAKSVDFIYLFYLSHPLVLLVPCSFKWLQNKVASFSLCFDQQQIIVTSWGRKVFDLRHDLKAVKWNHEVTFGMRTEEVAFHFADGSTYRIPLRAWGKDEEEIARFKRVLKHVSVDLETATRPATH